MASFVVVVEFSLKSGKRAQFQALLVENARASVRSELGCVQFDVLTPADEHDRVVLYEVYSGESAFLAHLETAHYAAFETASQSLVASKSVRRFRLQHSTVHSSPADMSNHVE
jgi:quinol monooxygenase YgiN